MFDVFFKKSPKIAPQKGRHIVVKILDDEVRRVPETKSTPKPFKEVSFVDDFKVAEEDIKLQLEFSSALDKIENISQEEFERCYAKMARSQENENYYRIIKHFCDRILDHRHDSVDSFTPWEKRWWKRALVAVRKINKEEKVVVVDGKMTYVIDKEKSGKKYWAESGKNVIMMPTDGDEEQHIVEILSASDDHNKQLILDEARAFYAQIVEAMKKDAMFAEAEKKIFDKQLKVEMDFVAGFLNDKYFLTHNKAEKKHLHKYIFEETHKK